MARDPALAGFGERFVAMFLDWILISLVAFFAELEPLLRLLREYKALLSNGQYVTQPAYQEAVTRMLQSPANHNAVLTFCYIAFGVALAYFWVLPAIVGATLGKRLLGLRVVSASNRSAIGVLPAAIRSVVFLAGPAMFVLVPPVLLLGSLLWLADGLAALFDVSRMQCLHDRLAGTAVVRKRWLDQQRAAPPPQPW